MKKSVKIIIAVVAVVLAVAIAIPAGIFGYSAYQEKAGLKITIKKDKTLNGFGGFGASACWWAQYCGNSEFDEEITKLLYSQEGLGLNIFRYNIGGGEADNSQTTIWNPWRKTESFYVLDEKTGEYVYDFTRDANAQKILDLALSYGTVDTVVLFANSPHFSMTISGKASGGGSDGWQSNLSRADYPKYVDYFLTITQYFLDKGVPVKYISPINEPQWAWGGGYTGQEGCHYTDEEARDLLILFAQEIKARGMDVKLSCPESGAIEERTERWFSELYNNEDVRDVLGTLAYHSYWSDEYVERKAAFGEWLNENMPDAKVEMSEWCQLPCTSDITSIEGALIQARVIANDLEYTGADSWSAWVGVNQAGTADDGKNYTDGLISANDDFSEYEIAMRYYAMAHFSKFIPAGSVRLESKKNINDLQVTEVENPEEENLTKYATNTVSYLTPDGKVVCVVVNEGVERDLSFKVDASKMTVYTTTQDSQLENTYSGELTKIPMPEKSIITVVFE